MYGVSRLCHLFRKLRKNFFVHLFTVALFLYCASVILYSADQNQREALSAEAKHQRSERPPNRGRQHEAASSAAAAPIIQPPVTKVNGAVDDREMAPPETLADKIVNRILTAYDKYPTRRPERVNPELDHIQDILNRFRDGDSDYYLDEYDDVDRLRIRPSNDLISMIKAMSDPGCREYSRAAAMTRLVVPDILEQAQYVTDNGEFVTLIAHMTEDRLPRLDSILQHWNGPVSIALCINISHVKDFISRLLDMEGLKERDNVLLHLVPEEGAIYPVNYLRNVAINNTKTKYIFLSDIDFIPVIGSHNILLEDLQGINGKKQVFIVPAFEEKTSDQYEFPQSKADLIPLWEKGLITPFHLKEFPPGHHRTDFARWKHAEHPYKTEWEPLFEPYIAGIREALPRYSQWFVGRGMNKIQQIVETVAMGFEMFVEPEIFLIHMKHSKQKSIATQDQYFKCSRKVMTEFNKYIRRKYGFSGQ